MLDLLKPSAPGVVEIVPAILAASLKEIEMQLNLIRGAARRVQIDVVDGHFARGKTWPYRDGGSYELLLSEEQGLPLWEEIDFEFDLMIEEPAKRALEVAQRMASRVTIHARAPGALEALQALSGLKGDDYGDYSVITGVAMGPGEQPELLEQFEGLYDYVQVMGIAKVGKQGQPFDPRAQYLVERLRKRSPDLSIQVDGAVTMETVRALAKAGANRLIVGHAVWEAEDPKSAIAALAKEANRV